MHRKDPNDVSTKPSAGTNSYLTATMIEKLGSRCINLKAQNENFTILPI